MADIPLAQAHPSEMLAALTATGVGLISLIGLIYTRMNKDIDGLSEDIDKLRDDVEENCALYKKEDATHLDAVSTRMENHTAANEKRLNELSKDIATVGNDLARIGTQIAQLAMSSTFTNEEIGKLEVEIKDLNRRLQVIEVEHKYCIELHKNLLVGNNSHHQHQEFV